MTADEQFKIAGSPKEQAMAAIDDAMSTYSAQGVPVIQQYLKSPDAELRTEAIEAMKQLGAPEAAVALRAAAREAKSPQERDAMIRAAEFVELPPLFVAPR